MWRLGSLLVVVLREVKDGQVWGYRSMHMAQISMCMYVYVCKYIHTHTGD